MADQSLTPEQVLIVDDHAGARRWLSESVARAFPSAHCSVAATLAEGRLAAQRQAFDLALLDLNLPDGSGLQLMAPLRMRQPAVLCVVATIYDDDEHLFEALRQGAAGYVLKEQSREQLADMLRGLVAGQPPLSPAIARRLMRQFSQAAPLSPPRADAALPTLTPRERETLGLIGKGYSVAQAASALDISNHTAHDHVRNIYRKLAIGSRAEAALVARELGL